MQWFYAKDNQQVGPVSDEQFRSLVIDGAVAQDTLVWHEGMDQWAAYSAMNTSAKPVFRRSKTHLHLARPASSLCSKCGQSRPADDLVQKGDALLCATCAEAAVQEFMRPAGFWIRFAAKILDGLILGVLCGVLGAAGAFLLMDAATAGNPQQVITLLRLLSLPMVALHIIYVALFVGKFGATPGKMALGLIILRANGSRVSYGRALGRFFAEFLSAMIFDIGYIMAAFDAEKRTLHDRICGTLVLHKS